MSLDAAVVSASEPADSIPVPDGMKLIWHDEFNGTGSPDSAFWNFEEGYARNHELQWYQTDNARLQDGRLIIEARKEERPNPLYVPGSDQWRQERENISVTSSSVNTAGKFDFTFGKVEVRAKIPTASGSWPAIWLLGSDGQWPSNGEIDMMEFYRIDGIPSILANACWGSDRAYSAVWDSSATPFHHFLDRDPKWADKFHVWTMDWTPEQIVLSLDGEVLNTIDLSQTVNGTASLPGVNPFLRPQYLLLNLAVAGDHGGEPDFDAFPLVYEVDYVRVFQNEKL